MKLNFLDNFYQEFSLIFGSILISIYLTTNAKEINSWFIVLGLLSISLSIFLKFESRKKH